MVTDEISEDGYVIGREWEQHVGDMVYIDDRPIASPICSECKHFWLHMGPLPHGFRCDAFPYVPGTAPIPMEIWLGHHDHRTPYPGDRGIRLEQNPDRPWAK